MWTVFRCVVLMMIISQQSLAAVKDWPEEAQDYLKKLPGQQLTVDFVLVRALQDADVFKVHQVEYLKGEALIMGQLSAEDLKINGSYLYTDNRNQPFTPFMPGATKGWDAQVGVEQYLSSGTLLSAGATHAEKKLDFSSVPDIEYTETRLSLGVVQSLLGDFLGSSYRDQRRASRLSKDAVELAALAAIETSTTDTVKLYYDAWLKQQNVFNLRDSLKRRQRLNTILKSQSQRGLIETSDALQVEGAALNNEADYINSKQDLQNLWEQLVVQLKLPQSFLEVPADEIPIVLDRPEQESLKYCETLKYDDVLAHSTQIQQLTKAVESAKFKYESLKQKLMPDVKLQANYTANAIDTEARQTWRDAGNIENPALTAGVTVSFPIQNRQQKSQVLSAHIEYEQSRLKRDMAVNDMQIQWRLTCSSLKRKIKNREIYSQVNAKNKKRVQLDNRRFEVGRIKAFQWVQSEDDEAVSALKLQQAEVDVRVTAWEIQKQTGHLIDKVTNQLQLKSQK